MGKPSDRLAGRHGSDVSQTGHKSLSEGPTRWSAVGSSLLLSCGAAVSKNLGCGEAGWVETALWSGGVSRAASMFGSTLRTPSSHACPGSWNGPTGKCGLSRQLRLCCDRFLQESLESGRWALGACAAVGQQSPAG